VLSGLAIELPGELVEAIVAAVMEHVIERLALHESAGDAWPAWMSVETAARYLDVSPERLRKLQARRHVPFHQEAPGCRVLFSRTDLDEWMTGFRQPARWDPRGRTT
jgi:excisionase family DNA binding protein